MGKYKNLENEIEREYKESLRRLSIDEFEHYLKNLIEDYYSVLFSFDVNYNRYVKNSNKKYGMIKKAKNSVNYNNIDNFENLERLKIVEEIAYKQMNELYFMERSYSNMIYSNSVQELIFINETLSELINLYEEAPNPEVLNLIVKTLKGTINIIRESKKLPLYEGSLEDYQVKDEIDKKYIKDLSVQEEKELRETIEINVIEVPVLSFDLKRQLEEFDENLKKIKEITEDEYEFDYQVMEFEIDINLSEKLYTTMLYTKGKSEEEKEEIYKTLAIINHSHEVGRKESKYLYQKIYNNWD